VRDYQQCHARRNPHDCREEFQPGKRLPVSDRLGASDAAQSNNIKD
jgi:hypothetical protein